MCQISNRKGIPAVVLSFSLTLYFLFPWTKNFLSLLLLSLIMLAWACILIALCWMRQCSSQSFTLPTTHLSQMYHRRQESGQKAIRTSPICLAYWAVLGIILPIVSNVRRPTRAIWPICQQSLLLDLQDLLYVPRDHAQTTPSGVLTPELAHHQDRVCRDYIHTEYEYS